MQSISALHVGLSTRYQVSVFVMVTLVLMSGDTGHPVMVSVDRSALCLDIISHNAATNGDNLKS